mmetsp:Transcript_12576/g.19486  ORF Transcript_12576/g.19486 Transcript_12576/m.19486 type:complete len:490 (-) Transcript_12576:66-1535(-)
MSAISRKKRWECSQCGMVNRAYRDVCFRDGCGVPRISSEINNEVKSMATPHTGNNDTAISQEEQVVEFKDENSKVIARLPRKLAQTVRSDLVYMVQSLVQQSSTTTSSTASCSPDDDQEQDDATTVTTTRTAATTTTTTTTATAKDDHIRRATALQKQMRKGLQRVSDFDDPIALWIYSKRKFFSRAMTSFELLRSSNDILTNVLVRSPDRHGSSSTKNNETYSHSPTNIHTTTNVFHNANILSFGGGPGNDLFGALLFEKYGNSSSSSSSHPSRSQSQTSPLVSSSSPQDDFQQHGRRRRRRQRFLGVYDFAPGWKPIVESVANISGHAITFTTSDLTYSLESPTNEKLFSTVVSLSTQPQLQAQPQEDEQAEGMPSSERNDKSSLPLSPPPAPSMTVTVYLFCYVLSEVMGPSGKPPPLLRDLLFHASQSTAASRSDDNSTNKHVFLFREPHTQALKTLLHTYEKEWKEGTDFWHLSCGGLMVLIET